MSDAGKGGWSIRGQVTVGLLALLILVGGFGTWAVMAEIDRALHFGQDPWVLTHMLQPWIDAGWAGQIYFNAWAAPAMSVASGCAAYQVASSSEEVGRPTPASSPASGRCPSGACGGVCIQSGTGCREAASAARMIGA